jgi:hypothetical protein
MADSAWRAKLGRARRHAQELDAALRSYSQLDPFELITELEGNDLVVRVRIRHEVPEELSLICGDLLHNARSALDLLITSVARDFALKAGRELSPADERALSFPVTRTESEFNQKMRRIALSLPGITVQQIRVMQPWSVVEGVLESKGLEITPDSIDTYIWMDDLLRLSALDNLDKHREVLALDFHGATITLGDGDFDPLDGGQEPATEPVHSFDELEPEIRENLMQTLLKMQEYDDRPEPYDFYFSDGQLHDGAEIGRYMRNDRGQTPGGMTARGNLRLVLWEPEVMARFRAAPPLQEAVRDMIDAVDRMCTFIETGLALGEETTPTALYAQARGAAPGLPVGRRVSRRGQEQAVRCQPERQAGCLRSDAHLAAFRVLRSHALVAASRRSRSAGCDERMVDLGAVRSVDRCGGDAMAKPGTGREAVTMIMPPEPPELNPEAARVLLRILLKAYEKKFGHEYPPPAES